MSSGRKKVLLKVRTRGPRANLCFVFHVDESRTDQLGNVRSLSSVTAGKEKRALSLSLSVFLHNGSDVSLASAKLRL